METDYNALLTDEILAKLKKRLRDVVRSRNYFWVKSIDDLMQDTILNFLLACKRGVFEYKDDSRLLGYLTRTATFNLYTLQKKSITRKEYNFTIDEESDLQLIDTIVDEVDPYAEEKISMHYAIGRLNARRREILERTIAGESISDISKALKCSKTAVSCAKFQAIKDVKEILEDEIVNT